MSLKDKGQNGDLMTPRERMSAFSRGEEIDRLPFTLFIGEHATRLTNVGVVRYNHDLAAMADAQIAVFEQYRPDGAGVGPGLFGVAEAMGARLKFPKNGMPYVDAPLLYEEKDLRRLVPADPRRDGRLPLFLEALQRIEQEIGELVMVGTSVGGPLTIAAALRGTENLLKDFYQRPAWVHELLKVVTESALNYIDAAAALGFKAGISEPTASCSLIRPSHFREFALPYLKMYGKRITKHSGSGPHLHICGDTRPIWHDMLEAGAGTISVDNMVDLMAVKEAVGDKIVIAGNVRPVETMLLGTPGQVMEEVRECLRKAYDSPGGYIVCPGCALPLHTPPENVRAFGEAVRRYARCPIDPRLLS